MYFNAFSAKQIHELRHCLRLHTLQTHRVELAEVNQAFEYAADKRSGAIKVTVIPE